jgi:hypothetical protein
VTDSILVDDEDQPILSACRWRVDSLGYAAGTFGSQWVRLHRVITKAQKGEIVDHINHNKLDNRRANLRIATHAENIRNSKFRSNNTSGYKGVYFCKQTGRWSAQIKANGKTRRLGRFDTAREAGAIYDRAASKLHGEFAVLNG